MSDIELFLASCIEYDTVGIYVVFSHQCFHLGQITAEGV